MKHSYLYTINGFDIDTLLNLNIITDKSTSQFVYPGKKQMLDHGPSVARISSTNESTSETTTNAKADPAPVTTIDITDTATPEAAKIPNANKWTVSITKACDHHKQEIGVLITGSVKSW